MRPRFHAGLPFPEAEPQELQLRIRYGADLRLLFVELQNPLALHIGLKVPERPLRRLSAFSEDHHVVGIPNETVSSALELVIELVEHDVGEDGTDGPALRRACLAGP